MIIKRCVLLLAILLCVTACSGGSESSQDLTDSAAETENTDSNETGDTSKSDPITLAQCQTDLSIQVNGTSGVDHGQCGSDTAPCASIRQGLANAETGDVVCVHSGTYNESFLQVPSGVTLVSVDGPMAAAIFSDTESAVRFTGGVDQAGIDGFEVYGSWNQGTPGDGLIRVYDATNISIRNCLVHDAPYDQDVIKVSGQVSGLLIENVVAWNPAHRTDGTTFQEVIDIFGSGASGEDPPPVSDVTIRGCWLFHEDGIGDWLIYSKIYAEKILYENNIFGPSAGGGYGNPAVGIGTGEAGIPDPSAAVVDQAIVRNNLFVGCQGDAAFAIMNADNTWVYNNTFYGNSGTTNRSVVMLRGNSHELGPAYLFNNIFINNHPSKAGARFIWLRNDLPSEWSLHNNLYYNNILASDTPYGNASTDITGLDPELAMPNIPDRRNPDLTRMTEIRQNFAISTTSPAVNAGIDAFQYTDHPNWSPGITNRRWDAFQTARPEENSWDLGQHEVD